MLIELFVQSGQVDVHIGMGLLNGFHTLGGADDVHHNDVFAAPLLQKVDGGNGAAAGSQHGIHHENLTVGNVFGQLAVVFHGLVGLGIPVQTDVTDFGGGDQSNHLVNHAQAGPQDGNNGQLLAGEHMALCGCHRGLHFYFLQGQLPGCLVAHQAGDLADQFPELLNRGILAAQDRQLVLNEGMIQYMYFCHNHQTPLFLWEGSDLSVILPFQPLTLRLTQPQVVGHQLLTGDGVSLLCHAPALQGNTGGTLVHPVLRGQNQTRHIFQ